MAEIHRSNAAEINRLYSIADASLGARGVGEYDGAAGVLLDTPLARERLSTPHRDLLTIAAVGLLMVINPRSPREFEEDESVERQTIDALLRHDPDWGTRSVVAIPRSAITGIRRTETAPHGFNAADFGGAAVSFARIEVADRSGFAPVNFWLDTQIQSRDVPPNEAMSPETMLAAQEASAGEHLNDFFVNRVPAFLGRTAS